MGEEVSIAGLRAKQVARRAGLMARVQSVVILLLFLWMAQEYNNNEYFQAWAARTLGMFGFVLGGTIAAFYSGILIAVYLRPPTTPVSLQKAEKPEPMVVSVETR
jgi:hypothetical protein